MKKDWFYISLLCGLIFAACIAIGNPQMIDCDKPSPTPWPQTTPWPMPTPDESCEIEVKRLRMELYVEQDRTMECYNGQSDNHF